jgi:UMF1 family MFS transporter
MLSVVAVLVSSLAALAAASLAGRMSRFTLLAGLTAGLLAAMVALAWNPNGSLSHAALAFVAAQSFYFAAMSIYESYLPDIAPPEARQKVSGFGWAIGYLGGIVAIIVLLVLIGGRPQSVELLALCFTALAVVGGLAFAIVIPVMRREGFADLSGSAEAPQLGGVLAALRTWRSNPGVFQLLLGAMLVQMGIFVVVTFTAPILADRFGQSFEDLLWLLLIIHIVSVPSTLAWSHMMTGASRLTTTLLLLASWGVVLLLLTFGTGPWVPLLTIMVIGCCLGATFSGLRGFLAENIGTSDPVALFALANAAGRMAAALGPALFSIVMLAAGQQVAMLLILLVFACGVGIILSYVRRESRLEEKPAIPPAQ